MLKDIDYERYVGKYGKRASQKLSVAGKNQQLINAMNTPVGKEFLRILATRLEENRDRYEKLDVDVSNNKFIEAKSRLNESEDVMRIFLKVLDDQERLYSEIIKEASNG